MLPSYYCNSLTQLIFLILLQLIQLCRATIFSHSLQQCQEKCLERNLAFPLPHDHLGWPNFAESNCEFDCLLDACRLGCQDLESLNSSCDLRCDSIGAGSAACHQGCRAIADIFLHQIQHLLDFASVESFSSPVSPGIGLNWSFPEAQSTVLQEISTTNIHWVAQSRAAGKGQGWRWTPMEPKAFKENLLLSTVFAPAEAHSDIELRLAAIWRDIVVVSRLFRQSVLIESQDAGGGDGFPRPRPTEGPQMQLSDASFVVCWNTAARSAAAIHETPLFRLRLFSTGEDGTLAELVAANRTSSNCHLFRNVTEEKGRRFRLAIAEMGSLEQQSPEQEQEKSISEQELQVNVTLEKINEPEAAAPVVVFTDGASLYLLDKLDDFVMVTEPAKIQLSLNESQTVTALGCLSSSGLLIGLSDGSIFSCDILEKLHSAGQDANETTDLAATRVRVADGIAIRQILVDHLQERFYAVRDKLGIVRCQLHSCDNSTTLAMTNAPNFLQRMAPDPWNGFLYYSYNTGDVFSTPLFPLDASQNYSQPITRRIAELPPISTLEVDLREQRLMVVTKAGQLLSRDLVDGSVQETREGWTLNDQYKNVIRSQFHRNRLFWISTSCGDSHPWESCLYSEEFNQQDKTIHLNKYLFTGAVKEFVLLRAFYSPPFMITPAKVGLLLTEAEALISWKPPLSLPYQASGSVWRSLSYEFILQLDGGQQNDTDTDTDTQTSTIVAQSSIHHQTHLHTPIGADGDYTALVKACTGAICSAPVSAKNRPIRLGLAHKTVSLLTKRPTSSSTPTSAPDSTDPLGQQLVALDLLGRELPAERTLHFPPIPSEPSVPIAFDNSSNVLFSSSRKESIVSQRIDGNAVRFLDSAFVHQMALNGPTATAFLATAYSVFAYRMTANFDKIVYNCAVGGAEEECGEVIGIASSSETPAEDGSPAKLFLLVQLPSGVVQLLQTDADLSQPFQTVSSTKDFPHKIRQMAHADGRLLLLTEDGFFGTLDSNLHEFNLNLVVRDVQHLLVADQASRDRHLHFQGPIQFDDKLSQLRWSIADPDGMLAEKSEQPLLFKLTLFRDGFGSASGERSVAISQESAFTLPPRLLQAWNSRQRFDVQVEAISPWTHAWANRTGLNAATKPPSPPENVRIYATQQRTVDGTRAIIDLFWDEPREWNGEKLGYQLNCSISQGPDQKEPVQYQNTTLLKGSQRTFSFAVRSGRISCLVFAMNDQHLMGPPAAVAEIDGSEFKPLIRLFAIDSTDNLVAIQNWTIEAQKNGGSKAAARFLAKHRRRRQIQSQQQTAQYQTITFVGNELYAVRKEAEMPQLFLAKLDMDQVPNQQILYKASLHGDFTQIDAMAADWVANRLLLVGNRELMQIQLDQLQQDSTTVTPKRLLQLSMGAQDAKQLVFDPFTNTAFLLTKNGSLFALDLNQKTETNLELTTGCLRQKTVTAIVGEFTWNRAASPQLYALTWNGLMELKLGADTCPDINVNWELFGERGLKAISLFAVADKVFVFATPNELLVYDRISASISQFPIPSPPLRQLLAVSQSAQPFPNRDCFQLASASAIAFSVRNEGRTGALVEMAEPQRDPAQFPAECQNISQPQTQYEIQFRKRNTDKKKVVHSSSNKTFIDQGVLDKNTDYDVSASWFNRYWPAQGQSESKPLHTGYGFPSAPKNPQAISLSPDTVLLSWSPPDLLNALPAEIRYRVSQQNPALSSPVPVAVKPQEPGSAGTRFSSLLAEVVACEAEKEICQAKVPNLRPSTDYHFWVTAVHISRVSLNTADDSEATSVETLAHTRDIPGTLRLENATSTQMNLRWIALPGAEGGFPPIESIHISAQYRQSGVDALWTELHNSSFVLEPNNASSSSSSSSSSPQRPICVDELRPATNYDYRYAAEYAISLANEERKISEFFFQQPQQARTKAGTPSAPTDVQLVTEPDNGGWTLRWKAPDSDGGEPIQSYAVEYRMDSQSEWEIAERGLPADRLYWHVSWAESHARHGKEPSDAELAQGQFRVRAQNAEGFGDFGSTKALDGGEDGKQRSRSGIWWQLLLGLALGLLLCCVAAYATFRWKLAKRRRIRAKLHKPICLESLSQQIQQSHQTQMQFSLEVQNELKILPKITPDRVKVTRQLGMGSFGRVCEGFVRLDKENNNVRVAIKFLKDNSQENSVKFLKEAILMNNFDHPNIVKLLGVNMEQSEHFLVLELMDGGDLLNFLRDCRPKKGRPSRICMRDLIAMAVDAGRGCLYLETYKHVHRDIAARNCLISSRTSPQRVTKLADFGLARSMAVDYYRVNGQDMLPLRWLSPEVINHGLFTSKSDVWAFGVLLWEIVTLGEQPYANRQNPEVLNLLTNGCTLERPVECPNELFDIMRACWTLDPEKRPRFVDIQPKMESMRGLPHFQARDPFPSGYWNGGFDISQESESTSTRESSTTTNGGDSSAGGIHFEKSENSISTKRHPRLSTKQGQHQNSSAFSTATASTALDSADYELPIRPSSGVQQQQQQPAVVITRPTVPLPASPSRPLAANSSRRRSGIQNDAFVGDSSTEGQQLWASKSYQPGASGGKAQQRNYEEPSSATGKQQFGASSSRVSRV